MAAGLERQAIDLFEEAETLFPRNVPLVISYSEALITAGRPDLAHALLLDLLNNVPPTPEQILLIARAANAEGDSVNAYHYMSEYYASIGDLRLAISQLRLALELPNVTAIERARFSARIEQFQDYLPDEER
jgi:predicted Zn-dependent protease